MNRALLSPVLFALACGLGAAPSRPDATASETKTPPPNFIVIMAEAQAWSGTSVVMDDQDARSVSRVHSTPALERLAREGMRFSQGYAASPRCTPSRAALLTGKSPAALHMTFVGIGRSDQDRSRALLPPEPILELPSGETTLPELLKPAGYLSAHFGKWHLGRVDPIQHGFDESDGPNGNGGPQNVANPNLVQAPAITSRAVAFIEHAQSEKKPFYLQLEFYPNQEARGGRKAGGGVRPESDDDLVDPAVAAVLAALDRLRLAENTFVIYTADHGAPGRNANAPLTGGKGTVWEGGLRVPFLVRGPGVPSGVCSHVPVTACDVLPTVAALAGTPSPAPAGVEGGNLVALLRDAAGKGAITRARPELVFHFPHYDNGNEGPASALLLGQTKLIRVYESGARRLYDLAIDPYEKRDLAKERPELVADLDARLTAYLREISAQLPQPNPAVKSTTAKK